MKKLANKLVLAAALVGSTAAMAAAVQNHVPDSFNSEFTPIRGDAGQRNHVLVVNVNNAIPAQDWPLVVNYAASRIPVNIWTNSAATAACCELAKDPASLKKVTNDPKAVVAVFVCDKSEGSPILAAPGVFSCVNVAWVKQGSPKASVLRDRYAKMVLKGIAAACGSGATIEPRCSMFYGTRTLEGLDKTNITISPMAYFPMVEVLRALGGDEATSVETGEE